MQTSNQRRKAISKLRTEIHNSELTERKRAAAAAERAERERRYAEQEQKERERVRGLVAESLAKPTRKERKYQGRKSR